MRAAVFREPRAFTLEEVPCPQLAPSGVLLRVRAAGICGSDLHSYSYGSFVPPGQIMGHEFAGDVTNVGTEVAHLQPGDRVTARPLMACKGCPRCIEGNPHLCETGLKDSVAYGQPGAFAEYVHIPRAQLGETVFKLPPELSYSAGAAVEPLSVALHAAKTVVPAPGALAIVTGLGSIGLNVVQCLKALGVAHVIGVDLSSKRLHTASNHGADTVINPREQDLQQTVRAYTGPGPDGTGARADIILECSGVAAVAERCTDLVRHGGTVRLVALYEDRVALDTTAIVQKELDIRGTFAYHGEFQESIELLRSGRVEVADLISHTFSIDQANSAFETQLDKDESVKVEIQP